MRQKCRIFIATGLAFRAMVLSTDWAKVHFSANPPKDLFLHLLGSELGKEVWVRGKVFSLRVLFIRISQFPQSRYLLCVLDCNSTLDKWCLHSIHETGLVSALGYLWSSSRLPSRSAFRSWRCHLTLSGCLRIFSKIVVISFNRTTVRTGEVEA